MEVRDRTKGRNCQKCKRNSKTSFMEQAILHYVKMCFDNVISRHKGLFPNNMELDVYLPDLLVGIEFDGAYFHQRPEQRIRDRRKYEFCKQKGIMLIRVTEDKRKPFDYESDYLITLDGKKDSESKNQAIISLLFLLSNRDSDFNVSNHYEVVKKVTMVSSLLDVERDRFEILSSCLRAEYKNSLEYKNPEIASEWNYERNQPLTPSMLSAGSNEKVFWTCPKCGNVYPARIVERTGKDKTSCPKCSLKESAQKRKATQIRIKGSLAETNRHLLKKWNYEKNIIKPDEIVAGSHDMVYWKCDKCGYDDWLDSPHHMTVRNSKCPCCLNRVLVKGINDLKTKRPDLVLDWDYEQNSIKPDEVVAGGVSIIHWKCHICGHTWKTKLSTRINGEGCPKCALSKQSERQKKHIYQYTKNGTFIREWNSISEASKELGILMSGISVALKNENKSAGGFKWKYVK